MGRRRQRPSGLSQREQRRRVYGTKKTRPPSTGRYCTHRNAVLQYVATASRSVFKIRYARSNSRAYAPTLQVNRRRFHNMRQRQANRPQRAALECICYTFGDSPYPAPGLQTPGDNTRTSASQVLTARQARIPGPFATNTRSSDLTYVLLDI